MRSNPRREFIRHTVDVPLEVEPASAGAAGEGPGGAGQPPAAGEPGPTGDAGPRSGRGVNVSHGGLAFLSTTCPEVGDVLRIRIPTVDPPFEGRARVAWCRPESDRYLVGVQFLDAAAAFQSRMVQQVCSIENYRKEVEEGEGRELTTQEAAAEWIEKYAGRFPDSEIEYHDDGDRDGSPPKEAE